MTLIIGQWRVRPDLNRLEGPAGTRDLEPKVMDLLVLLAGQPGDVVSREDLRTALWRDVVVGEDTIARCVFKLRRALGDDSAAPRFVETVAKRGYRLIAPVTTEPSKKPPPSLPTFMRRGVGALAASVALLVISAPAAPLRDGIGDEVTIERARDYYARYTKADNDAAGALYARVLRDHPRQAEALAGLAMVQVQSAVRWSGDRRPAQLGAALKDGRLDRPDARKALDRADRLVGQALAADRSSIAAWQALGLVRSAQGDLKGAEHAYDEVLRRQPRAWGAMINLADVLSLDNREEAGLVWLERAYVGMTASYGADVQRLGPWLAPLGVEIARRYQASGRGAWAELWLRRVLADAPSDMAAASALAQLERLRARAGD